MAKQKLTVTIVTLVLLALPWPRSGQTLDKPKVGFCVMLTSGPLLMYKRYQPLMDYLTAHTPYQFELILSRTNLEALHAFSKGSARLALLDDIAFVEAYEKLKALPILKPLNGKGEAIVRSAIVVPQNSPIRSVKDLRGKSIVVGSHHSAGANLLPRYLLARSGIDFSGPNTFRIVKNQADVVKAVLTGASDAGAMVESVAEQNTGLGLRILATSDALPSLPILARHDAPERLVEAVTTALMILDHNRPEHEMLMRQWDPALRFGFSRAGVGDYRQMVRMYKALPVGCGKNCHPRHGD